MYVCSTAMLPKNTHKMLNLNKHRKSKPKTITRLRIDHMCVHIIVYHCSTQHKTVRIIFPFP